MITVYEAKPTYPLIEERKVDEIKGQRVYYTRNGRKQWDMAKTTYSAIFPTREEAKQYCIDYANEKINDLQKQLGRAFNYLEDCKNL